MLLNLKIRDDEKIQHMDWARQNIRYFKGNRIKSALLLFAAILFISINSDAQYFGRNKPSYRTFKFDVLQTPHFQIYHYLKNDSLLNDLSKWSENWYKIHQKIFKDTFNIKNPIIFYTNPSDFQQTNAVSGLLGTGVGGVTEELKHRVILPVATTLAQTDHTLGHELVHAFQYHLLLNPKTPKNLSNNASINNIPLWMIEGMAEYLSLGSVDPNTAMWMRDALLNNDFPTLRQLETDSKYFPYRYGQAFWAMAGKTWGDSIIVPLLVKTARYGFDRAADTILGYNEKTLSGMWKSATQLQYAKYLKNKKDSLAGRMVVSDKNGGRMNISPSISPDGKYIVFFSEKNLFTLDLFLAEAGTGKIIRKLSSIIKGNEIDDFDFIESAGTWSPDGSKFAFAILTKGEDELAILDIKKGKIFSQVKIPGVPSFSNPAWSPDGRKIVLTGLVEGISDLYLYDLRSNKVEKLTDDFPSELEPSWSADGNFIAYSQEKVNDSNKEKKFSFDVMILDMRNKTTRKIYVFNGAYNLNPVFSADDKSIYFLSDADGFRNLYNYNLESNHLYRLTDYMTGISGITPFSPAISISKGTNLIAYNYYFKSEYQILAAYDNQFTRTEVDRNYVNFDAGTLPPLKYVAVDLVDTNIYNREKIASIPIDSLKRVPYHPRFKLDYITNNAGIGLSTGIYRNNMGGSINMIFSDMVGNNQLYTALSLNGQVYDFGGQVAYLNQKSKIKWGAAISHIPYLTGSMYTTPDSLNLNNVKVPVDNMVLDYIRMFEDNISVFASYPISQSLRFEGDLSSSWFYYRIDRYNTYYLPDGTGVGQTHQKMPAPPGGNYQQASLAFVEDNSYFGMTAPMQGHRARYQVEKYLGTFNVYTSLIDYRRYFYIRPVTLAFRLYNYGMYGSDSEIGKIPPLYLGYPWFIRGYENLSAGSGNNLNGNAFNIAWLTGSKVALFNAEVRLPFTGPERLAVIKSKFLLTDLNLFFDSGLAWDRGNKIKFELNPASGNISDNNNRVPVFSTGVSVRINIFGALILEPYYAFPIVNGGITRGVLGLNFVPGW